MSKDKKQIIVLGALFAVILAVGAFQFLGKKPAAVAEDEPKKDSKDLVAKNEEDPTEMVIKQLYSQPLASRDPFVPQAVIVDDTDDQQPIVDPPVVTRPDPMQGEVRPVDPGVVNGGNGQPNLEPTQTRDPWYLRGVILGRKTMAMLEDDKGNQFLVREGEQFNAGNTRVLSISKTQVELSHNGRIMTLALLGGN